MKVHRSNKNFIEYILISEAYVYIHIYICRTIHSFECDSGLKNAIYSLWHSNRPNL